MRTTLLALPLALGAPFAISATGGGEASTGRPAPGRDVVALKAGTIHLVEDGRVIENGGTVLIRGNRIHAVGADLAIPLDARVVDYGPDAVIIPGLVAADSGFGTGTPSQRTAEPGLWAIENFDFFAKNASTLAAGVTTAYIHPSNTRLISGQGAVVKLAGEDEARRVLSAAATVDGAIHSAARNTPGYWEIPVPATVDVGLGYAKEQLPKTTMGAIVALNELVEAARGEGEAADFGPHAAGDLARLLDAGLPWRMTAHSEGEIRALLDFARERELRLILDEATYAKELAGEIASAGVAVVYQLPFFPNRGGVDRGKGPDARWPSYDVVAALIEAGVRVAITPSGATSDLLFAANAASWGDLEPSAALRSITLTPAEILGVDGRVGSIQPGKDADLVVLNAPPLSGGAQVQATWVDGRLVWSKEDSGSAAPAAAAGGSVVIVVDELHIGDGRVLSPGQVVIKNGKITSVTRSGGYGHGGTVVRGKAAMPGMIDALGHLGLEGSRKIPATDYKLSTIAAPGDEVDRKVALAGITTVVLSPRGTSGSGAPVMAYKPAATDIETQIVADPVALRLQWEQRDRLKSGESVRELLAKAKTYREKWIEYEKAIAAWVPPPSEPEGKKEEAEGDEESGDEKKDADKKEDAEDEDKKGDDKKSKKKKRKKKGEEEEVDPDPITGIWEAMVARPPRAEESKLRMQLRLEVNEDGGGIEGNLRCSAVTDGLVDVEGFYDAKEHTISLTALGSQGWVQISAKYSEAKLEGTLTVGSNELDLEAERTSRDYVVAKRSERRPEKKEKEKEPKGKPKKPRFDAKLEPLRRAMEGAGTVIVGVQREDEILECVAAFEEVGIAPVLHGARDAHYVADRLAGRIAGILLAHQMKVSDRRRGTEVRNPYEELQSAGIPVAFHSGAEEGAIDLPMMALYSISRGMSAARALSALTSDAARMLSIDDRVGLIEVGRDGDVLLLDGPPLAPGTRVLRAWVNGAEVH